ncbi:uncharacterized protein TNCV_4041181 [Trichonephila clavipes]|nr:uncharacterized protein TNCV_4041181 [Trichonephila clavipes]
MIYFREEDFSDYNKLKAINCVKKISTDPYECLNQFKKAQKLPNKSYVQFASRFSVNFNYYCQLWEVNGFKSVCELKSDKIIETLDRELNAHIGIKQGEMWFKPQELARECDIFISSKGKIREQNLFPKFKHNEVYNHRGAKNISSVNLSSVKNVKRFCCKSKEFHPLYSCPKFKSLSVSERVGFVKANQLCFKCFSSNCNVKSCHAEDCFCKKPHNRLIHFSKPDNKPPSQIFEGSVLNPLAGVFRGLEGSDCVVSPQGGNEENKSFVAMSFLKNKTRTILLSSVQCYLRDRFGILHEVELPWKGDNELSETNLEKRRLRSPMRKMQSDKVLYSEYCKVFMNYLDEGIEKVTNPFISTNDPVLYFPHQVIIKNESLTMKQQIVFDASACERVLKEEMGSEKSDEDMELPQATERVLPLESE